MAEALQFFYNNQVFVYLILGILAVWQLRKFTLAWDDLRSAAFGLEQESARGRVNLAASMLVLVFLLGVSEFSLVYFVLPGIPEASPLFTPTMDLLATPTITLEASPAEAEAAPPTPVPLSAANLEDNLCIPTQLEITSPEAGETIQGVVEIYGSADIPNFGFYKFEMADANTLAWLTIQAGDTPTRENLLGYWDTSRLATGDYWLRLIVTDNQGTPSTPCAIRARVEAPSE